MDMRKNSFFILSAFMCMLLFSGCRDLLPNYYDINYSNGTAHDIYYCALDHQGKEMNGIYPDTTITFNERWIATIKAHSYVITNIGISPVEDLFKNSPSDTLSVFYFHPDTVAKYSWEEIRQGYKILRRYDLSLEDIYTLYNKSGVPEIPYPPDERMKNMKMYPPYGMINIK